MTNLRPLFLASNAIGVEAVVVGGAALLLWVAPSVLGEYPTQVLFRFLVALLLAEAWNLLGGYTGLVSLGTSSAVGVGGYVLVWAVNHGSLALAPALLLATLSGAALAAIAAPALLRLRGLYFTVGTLALAEILRLLMINISVFGGATGLFLDRDPPELPGLVHIAIVLLLVSALVQAVCARTRASVLLRAVRDDEDVAAQLGVRAVRVKLLAFATASALMAAAGGAQALKLGAIEPYGMFGLRWSIDTLSMVVIGGLGSRVGPLLGAALLIVSGELLSDFPEAHLALTGLLLIVTMRFAPRGLAGLARNLLNARRQARAQVA